MCRYGEGTHFICQLVGSWRHQRDHWSDEKVFCLDNSSILYVAFVYTDVIICKMGSSFLSVMYDEVKEEEETFKNYSSERETGSFFDSL